MLSLQSQPQMEVSSRGAHNGEGLLDAHDLLGQHHAAFRIKVQKEDYPSS